MGDLFKQYLEHLFLGKRAEARGVVMGAQDRGVSACRLLKGVIWPAMEQVDKLFRDNHISRVVEHMATRINRSVADQLQPYLARKPKSGKRMIVVCGKRETEELGAQITADLFEAEGWNVWLLGTGVPNDEVLQLVAAVQPDVLTIYGAGPGDVPAVRKLIELNQEVGSCDGMQIMVVGGVFNRAEGLAEEVGADLSAGNIQKALRAVDEHPVRVERPDIPEPGRRRKRKTASGKRTRARAKATVGA